MFTIHGILGTAVQIGELRYQPGNFWTFMVYRNGTVWLPATAEMLRDLCCAPLTAWVDECLENGSPSVWSGQ